MTSIDITRQPDGLQIQVTATGAEHALLLDTFTNCADGQCECDCEDYDKVEAMHVRTEGDTIVVDVRTRAGETIEPSAVDACLDAGSAASRQ